METRVLGNQKYIDYKLYFDEEFKQNIEEEDFDMFTVGKNLLVEVFEEYDVSNGYKYTACLFINDPRVCLYSKSARTYSEAINMFTENTLQYLHDNISATLLAESENIRLYEVVQSSSINYFVTYAYNLFDTYISQDKAIERYDELVEDVVINNKVLFNELVNHQELNY